MRHHNFVSTTGPAREASGDARKPGPVVVSLLGHSYTPDPRSAAMFAGVAERYGRTLRNRAKAHRRTVCTVSRRPRARGRARRRCGPRKPAAKADSSDGARSRVACFSASCNAFLLGVTRLSALIGSAFSGLITVIAPIDGAS